MKIEFLNEDLTEAVVRRRRFPIFGAWVEAVVMLDPARKSSAGRPAWKFASGDQIAVKSDEWDLNDHLNQAVHDLLQARARDRNWRPARTRIAPADLVQSRVDLATGTLVRK